MKLWPLIRQLGEESASLSAQSWCSAASAPCPWWKHDQYSQSWSKGPQSLFQGRWLDLKTRLWLWFGKMVNTNITHQYLIASGKISQMKSWGVLDSRSRWWCGQHTAQEQAPQIPSQPFLSSAQLCCLCISFLSLPVHPPHGIPSEPVWMPGWYGLVE